MNPAPQSPFNEICVYVAGAYNATAAVPMFNNMRKGMRMCKKILKMGRELGLSLAPFCPWLDFHFALVGDGEENDLTLEDFYSYSIAWLRRCDYVLLVPGWENSKGTQKELDIAREENIPVFGSIVALLEQIERDNAAIKIADEFFNKPEFQYTI